MSKNKLTPQERDLLLKRRDIVTSLWARGMSQREIVAAMANPNNAASFMVNPETGKPYDLAQINRDIRHVREKREESINASLEEHKAQQEIMIMELYRAGWAKKDLKTVATAIELMMKLKGTISTNLNMNLKRKPESAEGMSDAELEATIAAGLAARRSAGAEAQTPSTNEPS